MDELIKMVTQKVGISESQARSAVETVVSFLKDKMPGGLGSQVESFINGNVSSAANVPDSIKDKIGGLMG
jgi:nucleoid DNA-binding protein